MSSKGFVSAIRTVDAVVAVMVSNASGDDVVVVVVVTAGRGNC